jgi:Spy/CpxP family protein refolding chaperone
MKKILLVAMAILALSFVLFAEKAEKPAMDKQGMGNMCPDCQNKGMMMDKGEMGPGMMDMKDMMKELNLTKEQKVKFDAMKDENMKFMNSKKAELENLQIDKRNAMQAENYNQAKQINKSITDLQLTIENAMVDHRAAMMKELTPEQKAKLQEMRPMGMGMGQGMKGCKGMKDKGMHDKGMKGKCEGMDKPCTGFCK